MKISKLIEALQEIDSTVPFDSDVVTGDDWMPSAITRIYHKPPLTYIEFESVEDDPSGENFSCFRSEWTKQEIVMRQAFILSLLTNVQTNEASIEDTARHIELLLEITLNCGVDAGIDFMKQINKKI